MCSSAEDLGHELIALLDGGQYGDARILQPGSVKAMFDSRGAGGRIQALPHGLVHPAAPEMRRLLWKNEVFGPNDDGTWRVEPGNLLICERSADFVAVARGTEPVQLPTGTVLLSTEPLAEDGWLQPNNATWVLRD